jgi:hypothetical protein
LDEGSKANLLIEKFPGVSSNGTGLPDSYSGSGLTIDPDDAAIVWNTNRSRWEVSFDVIGFSGFFIKTQATTLPLTLISFTGIRNNSISQLKWETANENQVNYFELERSADGNIYSTVKQIAAKNGSSQQYHYADHISFSGVMRYRLKMVDIDGTVTYSKIVLLKDPGTALVSLYPNPAHNKLWLESGDASIRGTQAVIVNAAGAVQLRFVITAYPQPVDISALKSGIYFVQLANGSVMKFIKE